MERMMPIDLERLNLRKAMRGYDTGQVDSAIEKASQTIKDLLIENQKLKEECDKNRAQIQQSELNADSIRETLVIAQRAAEEARANANQHAAAILEEARTAALAERVANQQRVSELRWEFERIRGEKERYVHEYRMMLQRQLGELTAPIAGFAVVEGEVVDRAMNGSAQVAHAVN